LLRHPCLGGWLALKGPDPLSRVSDRILILHSSFIFSRPIVYLKNKRNKNKNMTTGAVHVG